MSRTTTEMPLTELRTLTIKEAATLTGLKRERIDEAVLREDLRIMKIPGVRRVHRQELDRWLESLIAPLSAVE